MRIFFRRVMGALRGGARAAQAGGWTFFWGVVGAVLIGYGANSWCVGIGAFLLFGVLNDKLDAARAAKGETR